MDSWVDMTIYVHSTCKGVLDKALKSWVSVSSFKGIRFRIRISRGRISLAGGPGLIHDKYIFAFQYGPRGQIVLNFNGHGRLPRSS